MNVQQAKREPRDVVRRWVARSVVVVAAIVPWALGIRVGLVLFPQESLGVGLEEAYSIIGSRPIPAVVGTLLVGLALTTLTIGLCWSRLGAPSSWYLDREFSGWRVVRSVAVVYPVSFWLSWIPSGLLTIRVGRLVPDFYDGGAPDLSAHILPWDSVASASFLVFAAMVATDVVARFFLRNRRVEAATDAE